MVPRPRFASWDTFNAQLEEQCRNRQGEVVRGHRETIGEHLRRDCEALMVLPPAPFDACDRQGTRVSSLSLVRYRTNDYSVPVAYGHREVWIRGYVHQVVIGCGAGIIARHPRSYERDDMVFDPIHYLPLLEQKIAALDQAAPLAGWELPDAFPTLRRLLEARMGKSGKREYVQVNRPLHWGIIAPPFSPHSWTDRSSTCPRGMQISRSRPRVDHVLTVEFFVNVVNQKPPKTSMFSGVLLGCGGWI